MIENNKRKFMFESGPQTKPKGLPVGKMIELEKKSMQEARGGCFNSADKGKLDTGPSFLDKNEQHSIGFDEKSGTLFERKLEKQEREQSDEVFELTPDMLFVEKENNKKIVFETGKEEGGLKVRFEMTDDSKKNPIKDEDRKEFNENDPGSFIDNILDI